jgi:2-polyprenyl-3-methyl-5-hydroxy-6-metoxy-1,4-benzoquinol methylase
MKTECNKEKYEEFHKNASINTKIVNSNDFTYKNILPFLDNYIQSNTKVLDIGCGIGTISLYVANKGNRVIGTDISEKATKTAQKSAKILGLKGISFITINFMDSNFLDEFDFVVCSEVLEHLVDDRSALRKMNKLMKDDACLFLTVPSSKSPIHKIRKILFGSDSFDEKVGHLRRYSKYELVTLLEESDFEVIDLKLTEGVIRNFLFVTSFGNKFLFLTSIPITKLLITFIDNTCLRLFGEGQIITVSRKREFK